MNLLRNSDRENGRRPHPGGHVLVTGGAGFVGTNLSHRLAAAGEHVIVFDDLSRAGVDENLEWLLEAGGGRISFVEGDVRDADGVARVVQGAGSIFHLAAQVAVTTSLVDPVSDFQVNAAGTLNVLEAVRGRGGPAPFLLYTSSNKVLGSLDDVDLVVTDARYEPSDPALRENGIGAGRGIDFHSPYGCSKGAADQYVLDYARTYGVPSTVFRMSCIYGPHQRGTSDQGWVAHFARAALNGEPVTFYGDGKQVRDALFVDDLVDAMLLARGNPGVVAGRAYTIGGGPGNTVSLLELVDHLERLTDRAIEAGREEWRSADQRYYVSDIRDYRDATGWSPRVPLVEGLERLLDWLRSETPAPAAEPIAARGR